MFLHHSPKLLAETILSLILSPLLFKVVLKYALPVQRPPSEVPRIIAVNGGEMAYIDARSNRVDANKRTKWRRKHHAGFSEKDWV